MTAFVDVVEAIGRPAARCVVLDQDERVLLVRFLLAEETLWAVPGGGVQDGETFEMAAIRELSEEVGIVPAHIHGPIWERDVRSSSGFSQFELYFVGHTATTDIRPLFSPAQLREEGIIASAWWSLEDIVHSEEQFAPSRLSHLLYDLLCHGVPEFRIKTGL